MNKYLKILIQAVLSASIAAATAVLVIILYTNAKLPSVDNLEDTEYQVPLKIYTKDGLLIGEYGVKRRTPIDINEIPELFKLAIISTEDRRFYEHSGVDIRGLVRAGIKVIVSGRKTQGASTITMQVARNFYLTRKKTFTRKLNEILLAIKIEKELTKDQILELYLNKIYFGKRAYGVQAAAQVYYGVGVDQLTLAQIAMIAGLPQAPSAINPINNPKGAIKRRNHVLSRMHYYGFISDADYETATNAPITAAYHGRVVDIEAPHIAEMARREIIKMYGRKAYSKGLEVYTTVHSKVQEMARKSMQNGLLEYDKRHGYRGSIDKFLIPKDADLDITSDTAKQTWLKDWQDALKNISKTQVLQPCAIVDVTENNAKAILKTGEIVNVPFDSMQWAKQRISPLRLGPEPKQVSDVLVIGDVVYLETVPNASGGLNYKLSQLPQVQGALVSINPQNGFVEAMVGGFDYSLSNFNRATQANRQPGSNFKPFVYAAALEHGFNPASIINDAPVVYQDQNLEGIWRPQNDTRKFYGPTRLRVGLTKSRNLVSIRLLQTLGVKNAIETITKFGFKKHTLPNSLSLALGTAVASPYEIAIGYASFANGGFKVTPHIIETVKNSKDKIVFKANPAVICDNCSQELFPSNYSPTNETQFEPEYNFDDNYDDKPSSSFNPENQSDNLEVIDIFSQTTAQNLAPRIISAQTSYLMTSMLSDAIQTGTGRKAKSMNRSDIAGKTGTTNNKLDAWFSGYNMNLVTTVWVGYDEPRSLKEYGSQAALPIWIDFMSKALKGTKEAKMPPPDGIVTVKIDPNTGQIVNGNPRGAIFEVFDKNNMPGSSNSRPNDRFEYSKPYSDPYNRGYTQPQRVAPNRSRSSNYGTDSLF